MVSFAIYCILFHAFMIILMGGLWYQKYPKDSLFCILLFSHKRQRLELRWAREWGGCGNPKFPSQLCYPLRHATHVKLSIPSSMVFLSCLNSEGVTCTQCLTDAVKIKWHNACASFALKPLKAPCMVFIEEF